MKLSKILLSFAAAVTAFIVGVSFFAFVVWFQKELIPFGEDPQRRKAMTVPAFEFPDAKQEPPYQLAPVIVETNEDETCDPSPSGEYVVIGPSKKGLEGFEAVTVVADEYDDKLEKVVAVKPYGNVFWRKQEVKLASVKIDGNRLRFISKPRKGVSFSFDGKFTDEFYCEKDESGEFYEQQVNLKGNLVKFENGKKVSEGRVKFEMNCGC